MEKLKDFISCLVSPTSVMLLFLCFTLFYLLIEFVIKIVL